MTLYGHDHAHALPAGTGKSAGQPRYGPLHLIGKEYGKGCHAAAKKCSHGDAGQDEAQWVDAPFPGQQKYDSRRSQRPGKGGQRHQCRKTGCQHHQGHGGQSGSGRDADDARISQRVAQDPLKDAAGQGQIGAGQSGTDDAGHAQGIDNAVVLCRSR